MRQVGGRVMAHQLGQRAVIQTKIGTAERIPMACAVWGQMALPRRSSIRNQLLPLRNETLQVLEER